MTKKTATRKTAGNPKKKKTTARRETASKHAATKKTAKGRAKKKQSALKSKTTTKKITRSKAITRKSKPAVGSTSTGTRDKPKKSTSRTVKTASTNHRKATSARLKSRSGGANQRLGRSKIPVDAPLQLVFQHDPHARDAFTFLEIQTVRELESFSPDELVRKLTSPTKLMVGRIRKTLAMYNRSLSGDEKFAIECQKRMR